MKPAVLLVLALATTTLAVDESCVGRCGRFNHMRKCQCDSLCTYYNSCCVDYDTACKKKIARGDTFGEPEDLISTTAGPTVNPTTTPTTTSTLLSTIQTPTATPTLLSTTQAPPSDPDAAPCSERPFDAFLQLKNGSIYAFRGEYFFELDERAVVPGYPKLIKDVWGISGPVDAAFTRINCQGKTYIFKGNKYWRFEDDVLDEDYPRDISVGFEKIPDDVDAAFAIPAPGHHGKERVYFFKGDQYYQYEFQHQPSHEECVSMSRSSPSVLFTRYTDLYCDNSWEDLFMKLFMGTQGHHKGPHFIHKDWVGIKPPVDAAMVGRLYVHPKPTPSPSTGPPPAKRRSNWRRRNNRRRKGQRSRKSRSLVDLAYYDGMRGSLGSLFDYDYSYHDYSDYASPVKAEEKSMPIQNVYFFKKDKYYRVDLQTKRIDFANPPYPRSISKYWLGCKRVSLAEKR